MTRRQFVKIAITIADSDIRYLVGVYAVYAITRRVRRVGR